MTQLHVNGHKGLNVLPNMPERVLNLLAGVKKPVKKIHFFPSPSTFKTLDEKIEWGEKNELWKRTKLMLQCFTYPLGEQGDREYNRHKFKEEWFQMALQTMEEAMNSGECITKGDTLWVPTGMWDYFQQAPSYVKLVAQQEGKPWRAVGTFAYYA